MTCSSLCFTNIQGYPHDILKNAINNLPSFKGNIAITARDHLIKYTHCMERFCSSARYKHEDIKMWLFFLSLEGDAKNWFYDFPDNSFDSLQVIVNAFKNRYGD